MDDDDAFLYGDEPPQATASKSGPVAAAEAAVSADMAPPTSQPQVDAADQEDQEDEDDEEEDEEEDEDSDSDLEIVMDTPADAQPPPPPPVRRPIQPQPPPGAPSAPRPVLTEYTPLSRTAVPETNALPSNSVAASKVEIPRIPQHIISNAPPVLPEGPPPRAPTTAPTLDLAPAPEALTVPSATAEGEQMTIYHIDPSSLPEKPWRRPGADLTDWFNYGFDEVTWRDYGKKMMGMNETKEDLERKEGDQAESRDQNGFPSAVGQNGEQDAMAMMAMMNGNQAGQGGGFNPQMMAQMPPQQQMQFMSQMMANGGIGLEAMMAPFLPGGNSNSFGGAQQGFGHGMNGMGVNNSNMFGQQQQGMGGMGGFNPMQQQQQFNMRQVPTGPSGTGVMRLAPPPDAPTGPRAATAQAGSSTPQSSGADVKGDVVAGAGLGDKTDDNETEAQKEGLPTPTTGNEAGDDMTGASSAAPIKSEDGATGNIAGLPNPAGMDAQDMAVFLGLAGVDPAAIGQSSNAPKSAQQPSAGPAGPRRAVAPGTGAPPPTAPRGPAAARGRGAPAAVASKGSSNGAVSPASTTASSTPAAGNAPPTGPSSSRPIPTGPSAANKKIPTGPASIPTGPRNPGKRYNDRDTGSGGGDALDYGGGSGGAAAGSSSRRDSSAARRSVSRDLESTTGSTRTRENSVNQVRGVSSSSRRGDREASQQHGTSIAGRAGTPTDASLGTVEEHSIRGSSKRSSGTGSSSRRHRDDAGEEDRPPSKHSSKSSRREEEAGDEEREQRREERRERRRGAERDRSASPATTGGSSRRDKGREDRNAARASRRAGRVDEEEGTGGGTSSSSKRKRGEERGSHEDEREEQSSRSRGGGDDDREATSTSKSNRRRK